MTPERVMFLVLAAGVLGLFAVSIRVRRSVLSLEEDTRGELGREGGPDYDLVSLFRRLEEDRRALAMRLRFSRWLAFLLIPSGVAYGVWTVAGIGPGALGFLGATIGLAAMDFETRPLAGAGGHAPGWMFRLWARLTEPSVRLGKPLQALRHEHTVKGARGMVLAESRASMSPLGGNLGLEERRLLRKLLASTAILVSDIMTGWERVATTATGTGRGELLALFRTSGHSRLPVLDQGRVVGIIHVRDVLTAASGTPLSALVRDAYFVRWDSVIQEVLDSLRSAREHMAVAVDHLGRPVGVVTIEDILEEIVGELYDEREAPVKETSR